jgi:hypothetical protein
MKTVKSKKIAIFEGNQIRRYWNDEKEYKKIRNKPYSDFIK